MLKRNLIIIAIASLALILTSNAFGQEKNRKAKVNKPTTLSSSSQSTTGTRQTKSLVTQPKSKTNGYIGETEKNVTKPPTRTRNLRTNQTKSVERRKSKEPVSVDYPNLTTKKPSTYVGSSDDGQSMKQKPKNIRQTNQPNAVPTNPKPGTKMPVKPFIGGGEDGQSI